MKRLSSILVFFLSIGLIVFYGSSSPTDSLNLSKYRVLQSSGDISLPPNSFTINNMFNISFEYDAKNTSITMAIKFNKPGKYFSIGLGNQMRDADIWVFEIINGEVTAKDYTGKGEFTPILDSHNDLERLGYEVTPTYSLVKFRRLLDTEDPQDVTIKQGNNDLIWAFGNTPTMSFHGGSAGTVQAPLFRGVSQASAGKGKSRRGPPQVVKVHTIVNMIAWGLFADIGIILLRLFKGTKYKIGRLILPSSVIHSVIMMSVIIMSIVVTATIIHHKLERSGSKVPGDEPATFHYILGLILLFLILLTVVTGFANLLILGSRKRSLRSGLSMKVIHRVIGVIIYLAAKANVITGAMLYEDGKWRVAIFIYLFVLLLVYLMVEACVFYQNRHSNKVVKNEGANKRKATKKQTALLEALGSYASRESLLVNFAELKWLMVGNRVYDLTHWIHPGGNNIIQACIGREVGRYFYGNHPLEGSKIKPYLHAGLTVSQMKRFCIGELKNHESVLVSTVSKQEGYSTLSTPWKIVSVTPITETVSQINFVSTDFFVKSFGTSLTWLGRHFRISFAHDNSPARLYTTALSLTEANHSLRQNIYKHFDSIMSDSDNTIDLNSHVNSLVEQEFMPFFVKDYAQFPKGLSHQLHQTEINSKKNSFRIEGPIGRGNELTSLSSGGHSIICGGTGILSQLDFLNVFLMKNMYEIVKEKAGKEKAEELNVYGIPFDDYMNGLSINLIGAFANEKEVLGLDIIKKLAEISNKYNRNNFTALMRGYSDENIKGTKERFTADFLKTTLGPDEERYYVVGPPKLNSHVFEALESIGVPKERIIL